MPSQTVEMTETNEISINNTDSMMKRTIVTLALAVLVSAGGFSVMAQDNADKCKKTRGGNGAECAIAVFDKDREQTCDLQIDRKAARPFGCELSDCMLEGITLTPQQKAKVDALKQERKAENAKLSKERKEKQAKMAEKMRKERQKAIEKRQKEFDKRMNKLDKEMKDILTPEQYARFRSNVEKAKVERREKAQCDSKGRPGMKGKPCKKHKDKKNHCKKHHGTKNAECHGSKDAR